MSKTKLNVWIEGTICAALAIVLSFLPTNIGANFTISLGMIPLILFSFRRGVAAGIVAGFLWGVLHFLVGNVAILNLLQGFIEYFIAFMFTGFAGVVASQVRESIVTRQRGKMVSYIIVGTFIGTFARFFWHFVAGFYFWGSYAPNGMSAVWFSFIMNGGSALATGIVTSVVLVIVAATAPDLFLSKETSWLKK